MMNRRHFLSHLAGYSAMAIPGMQFLSGLRAAEDKLKKESKSLIIFWMGGGPSHMDLWDLKPGSQNGGEFKEIDTKASGVKISEVLPTVAEQFDKLAIVRALVTNEGSHERGTVLMNTGRQPSPVVQYPSSGSLVSSLVGSKDLPLPGFIGIGGTAQQIGPGFLGMANAPFTVRDAGQPPANIKPPAGTWRHRHGTAGAHPSPAAPVLQRRRRVFEARFPAHSGSQGARVGRQPRPRRTRRSPRRRST